VRRSVLEGFSFLLRQRGIMKKITNKKQLFPNLPFNTKSTL
jgi:hypothetical protein